MEASLISFIPTNWSSLIGDIVLLTTGLRSFAVALQKIAAKTPSKDDDKAVGKFMRLLDGMETILDFMSVGPTERKRQPKQSSKSTPQ